MNSELTNLTHGQKSEESQETDSSHNSLVHMGSQVPLMCSKSQHGDNVPKFEPQETIKVWLISIEVKSRLFYAKIILETVVRVGSGFSIGPTLNTTPELYLQNSAAM